MTLTGYLALNSVFAPVWLAETAHVKQFQPIENDRIVVVVEFSVHDLVVVIALGQQFTCTVSYSWLVKYCTDAFFLSWLLTY